VAVVNFLSLPLLFVSSVLFPLSGAPRWLSFLAAINPVHHGGELMKNVTLAGYVPEGTAVSVVYLLATGGLFLILSSRIIRKAC
jgi:ABC-2 type transport system permease protein